MTPMMMCLNLKTDSNRPLPPCTTKAWSILALLSMVNAMLQPTLPMCL